MSSEDFENEIRKTRRKTEEFRASLQHIAMAENGPLAAILEELDTAIEELRVSEEELGQQNDSLVAAREETENWRCRYEDLFQFAPDGYLTTDMNGAIQEANQAAAGMLNVQPRFLVGKPLVSFIPDEERRQFRAELLRMQYADRRQEWELRLRPRRQLPVEVGVTLAVVKDRQGRRTGLRWQVRDATAWRAAEAERFRQAVQEIRDYAIFTLDPNGCILSWNVGAEHITGHRQGDVLGQPVDILFTPEDRASGAPQGEMQKAAAEGRADDARWHLRKDGTRFWCDGVMTALRDGEGRVVSFAKVMRDFTARKQAEEEQSALFVREHHIAETFQQALLPMALPRFPGLEVAAIYESAWAEAEVGGDFYDSFALNGGRVALVVGDVSGKGLAAAVYASELRAALRLALRESADPASALARVNRVVCDKHLLDGQRDALFVTLTVAVVDPVTGEMQVSVAGAEPPLLLRADGKLEVMTARTLMLGVEERHPYRAETLSLEPGDALLLVTDGITEARRGREFLGYEGMVALAVEAHGRGSLHEIGQAILDGACDFAAGTLTDDACLLLARRMG